MKDLKINKSPILVVGLSIVCGFMAGIFSFSLVGTSGIGLPFFGQISFNDIGQGRNIVIDQPRSVIIEQDIALKQIENDIVPTLVNIYFQKKSSQSLTQVYLPSEALGQGFVLTADGWIVTTSDVISNFSSLYTGIGYQLKNYEFQSYVEDKATGVVFAKINSTGLPVASIGRSNSLAVGQTLVVASARGRLTLTNIEKIGYDYQERQSVVQSTEKINKEIILDISLDDSFDGAVVANLKGQIVGLVSGGRIIMIDSFANIISQVLDNQKIIRPVLGVGYIDLGNVDGLIDWGDKGALIYGSPTRTSPAFGQLKDGDIILKVNDIEISSRSLSELINEYRSGDQIELLVRRQGAELTIEVTLK